MSLSNGQVADETTFNNAFMSRTDDSNTVGKVDLDNTDPASGSSIDNIQRLLNAVCSFVGLSPSAAQDIIATWDHAGYMGDDSTDGLKQKIDALIGKFSATVDDPNSGDGHQHLGGNGDGPPLNLANIENDRMRGAFIAGANQTSVTGTTKNVSTSMSGETNSTGDTVAGAVVLSPNNRVILRDNSSGNQGDQIRSAVGDVVYARLTFSASVWTLSFFTLIGSTETAYSLTSQNFQWYYQRLYDSVHDYPIYSELAVIPSDNATQDVVDATTTQRGLINALAQAFGGVKSFLNGIVAQAYFAMNRADVATTATIAALSTSTSFVKMTGSTATSIQGATAGADGQVLTIYNGSSALITVNHQNGTASAANRFKLPAAADMVIGVDGSATFIYEANQSRWVVKSSNPAYKAPTFQSFVANGTYTLPTPAPLWIEVEAWAGGGGGGGGAVFISNDASIGADGGNTTFGTTLISCGGGKGALTAGDSTGGSASLGGLNGQRSRGQPGSSSLFASANFQPGAPGGDGAYGGGGIGGTNADTNTGAGGGGGNGANTAGLAGAGGQAGGYVKARITAPLSTYAVTIGAGGAGGAKGTIGTTTGATNGGNGADGRVTVWEHYQ